MNTITLLQAKIHRATVTSSCLDYEGSITIDQTLLDAAGMRPYQQVHVLDINNGQRFETYIIEGEPGSGVIQVNGAAARLVQQNDLVIIASYIQMPVETASDYTPIVVLVDRANRPITDPATEKAALHAV